MPARFRMTALLIVTVALGGLLAACASATPAPATEQPATQAPAVTAAPATVAAAEPEATEEVARPSNPGGPGPALDLTGDPKAGADVYVANCLKCHGEEGKGGIANPGSDDGTIPELNPIDATLVNADPKVYAYNLDLFMEHGSTPAGASPQQVMPAWGDDKKLTSQQIADVIAYLMSLNKP